MKPCYYSFIVTFLLAVTLGAAEAGSADKTPQAPEVNIVTPQKLTPAGRPQPQKTGKEPWPRTFIPSEKITADSVISFPADI